MLEVTLTKRGGEKKMNILVLFKNISVCHLFNKKERGNGKVSIHCDELNLETCNLFCGEARSIK